MSEESKSMPESSSNLRFARNVLVKALILFAAANLVFAVWHPMAGLGRISAYNRFFPGRLRLPYGENPDKAYNLSLYNLEAMFASHEISTSPKPPDEYRVIVIGDSSAWGFLLPAQETVSAAINAKRLTLPDGRQVRAYNLGYPVMSLAKDLVILSYAMRFEPDLIVWPLTLESFPYDKQLYPELLQNNAGKVRQLIQTYDLKISPQSTELIDPTFWDRTIAGARRELADLLRLQLYGILWAATGIDQDIPATYTARQEDLPADETFHDLRPPDLHENDLAFDILAAGMTMAGDTPVLIVNEPMFISQGENSDIRYNFFYPRWAYDDYRELMAEISARNNWHYLDLWDFVPPEEFTNSAVHMTSKGAQLLAEKISEFILQPAR
jgi:hypothetical protein